MDGARIAAMAAVALGGFAMMVNFLIMPMLMNKVSRMHADLQIGMQSFKAMADQAWDEMMLIRRAHMPRAVRDAEFESTNPNGAVLFPFGYVPEAGVSPAASDIPQQSWDQFGFTPAPTTSASIAATFTDVGTTGAVSVDNGCPPGPPGPPGDNGKDGLEGPEGLDGLQGQNATEMKFEDLDMCSICPGGPKGPAGPAGLPGPLGKKGRLGDIGKNGINGTTGAVGPAGKKGFQGLPGKPGTKGKPGKPAPGGKGKPGPKGATGPIGRAGPQGFTGNSSTLNNGTGPVGAAGSPGINGIPGNTGQPGPPGKVGIAGGEGGYCPCPKELKSLGLSDNATAVSEPMSLPAAASTQPMIATTIPPPIVSSPPAPSSDGTVPPQSPPQTVSEPAPTTVNFGGFAPSFGPPGPMSIVGDGGGVVALPPAGGPAFGGSPPSGQPPQQEPQISVVSLQNPPIGESLGGGLTHFRLRRTKK